MRVIPVIALGIVLAGCGGGGAGGGGKNDKAAAACYDYAKNQLGDQTYNLDQAALAASAKPNADLLDLEHKIVINPGLPNEETQTLKCSVRFNGETAEVISMNFIW